MSDKTQLPFTDKLIEFSKETVIQEQMTNSMNSAISTMRIPGAGNPMNSGTEHSNKNGEKPNES